MPKTNNIGWNAKEFTEEANGCWPLQAAPSYLRSLLSNPSIRFIKTEGIAVSSKVQIFDFGHLIDQVISGCTTCQAVNSSGPSQGATPGTRIRGQWIITDIKPGPYGYKYLLVIINTFSRLVDAYPTKETANIMAKKLLENIPRYGLPTLLWVWQWTSIHFSGNLISSTGSGDQLEITLCIQTRVQGEQRRESGPWRRLCPNQPWNWQWLDIFSTLCLI